MKQQNKPNPYIESIKKFIGQEVKIIFFNPNNEEDSIEGICESINYGGVKEVVIRTKDKKIFIPRYKTMERMRSNPEQ